MTFAAKFAAVILVIAIGAIAVAVSMIIDDDAIPNMLTIETPRIATPVKTFPTSGTSTPTVVNSQSLPVVWFVPMRLSSKRMLAWAAINPCAKPLGVDWRCYVSHYGLTCVQPGCSYTGGRS